MSDHFVMLWSDMLRSSINEHDAHVKWVFVVSLLLCDRNGDFRCTPESMARTAVIPLDQAMEALEILSSPDPQSTSTEEGGRRIVSVGPNQWRVVNYVSYRRRMLEEKRRVKDLERKRDERGQNGTDVDSLDNCGPMRTSVDDSGQDGTISDAVGVGVDVDVDVSPKKKKKKRSVFKPPSVEEVQAYLDEKGETRVGAGAFVDFYESKGWLVGKNKMKDWKAAVRTWIRQRDADHVPQRGEKTGPQHVGSSPPVDGSKDGWVYDTFRKDDHNNYGNHSMWADYADAAADFEPKTAPKFLEWLARLEG